MSIRSSPSDRFSPRRCSVALVAFLLGTVPLHGGEKDVPFRLSATHFVPLRSGSWRLEIDGSGRGRVLFTKKEHALRLPRNEVREIRDLIEGSDFFNLRDRYGKHEVEADLREIDVQIGTQHKRISLGSDMAADEDRETVRKLLRIWVRIRDLIKDPGAADSRPFDRKLLENQTGASAAGPSLAPQAGGLERRSCPPRRLAPAFSRKPPSRVSSSDVGSCRAIAALHCGRDQLRPPRA